MAGSLGVVDNFQLAGHPAPMSSADLPPVPPDADRPSGEGAGGDAESTEGGGQVPYGSSGDSPGRGAERVGDAPEARNANGGRNGTEKTPGAKSLGNGAESPGNVAISGAEASERLWAGPGAEQLAWLLAPKPVQGRLGTEWLRRSLKASPRSQEFMERHREDPMLEIEARCQGYLAKEALLLHPERLGDRLMALLAIRGRTWPGQEPIDTFLRRCLHDAADQLCLEDAQDERQQVPGDPELADDFALAAELFGVEAPFQRLVLLRFNRLPRHQRRTLFAWIARGIEPGAANANSTSARPASPNASAPGSTAPNAGPNVTAPNAASPSTEFPNASLPGEVPSNPVNSPAAPQTTPPPRATSGKDPSESPNSPDRLTLADARRILAQVLALPEGRQS